MKNGYTSALMAVGLFLLAKLVSVVKTSFAMGSFWTLFSLRNVVAPLSGAFGGILGAGFFFLLSTLSAMLIKKTFFLASLAFSGVPTFFSSVYWATESRMIRAGIPALCMALFVLHAQGAGAWMYALYWLVPIAASFFPASLLAASFGSTFTAHAVGSTIWLYATNMHADAWLALIPQVALERSLFALGMYGSYHLISYCYSNRPSFSFNKELARS